jgi:hypothetical protein
MIRFRSSLLFRLNIFKYFEYVCQLDLDFIMGSLGEDLFQEIDRKKGMVSFLLLIIVFSHCLAYFGYSFCGPLDCSEQFEDCLTKYRQVFAPEEVFRYKGNYFYGNFIVFRVDQFLHNNRFQAFLDYIDAIDGRGWKYRWAEQVTYFAAMSFTFPYQKTYLINHTIGSLHYTVSPLQKKTCPNYNYSEV